MFSFGESGTDGCVDDEITGCLNRSGFASMANVKTFGSGKCISFSVSQSFFRSSYLVENSALGLLFDWILHYEP